MAALGKAGGKPGGERLGRSLRSKFLPGLAEPCLRGGHVQPTVEQFLSTSGALWRRQEDALDADFSLAGTQTPSAQVCAVLEWTGPFRTAGSAVNHSSLGFCAKP